MLFVKIRHFPAKKFEHHFPFYVFHKSRQFKPPLTFLQAAAKNRPKFF
jgi:hypothetical protein